MSQFIVIGAGGFLGKALVSRLVKDGHSVTGTYRTAPANAPGAVLVGDLNDEAFCRRIAETPGTLIYAAAFKKNLSVHTKEPFTAFEENVSPLLRLLTVLREYPPRPFVYVSSLWVGSGTIESAPDGYADGKTANEMAVACFRSQFGWPISIVRIAPIYGPGNDVNPKTANVIPSLISKVAQSVGVVEVWGTGKRRMQFSYIDDAVNALLHVAVHPESFPQASVGEEKSVSVQELVTKIAALLNKDIRIVYDPSKPDKETALFTFTNPVTLEVPLAEGLARTVAWMRKNGYA